MTRDRLALAFAHLVAIGCMFAAGWFVHTQASATVPMVDEWKLLADRLAAPSVPGWCLEHLNQHRYPLGKAVWVAAMSADGGRFRLGQFLTVGLLTASSVLLIWAARGMRGRAHVADAMYPILLLNFGHAYNLLMSFQLAFALIPYGLAGWLWAANRLAQGGGMPWAIIGGLFGSVVVQSGGFGLLFTVPLSGWAMLAAARMYRPRQRAAAHALAGFTLAWLIYGMWIVVTMPATPRAAASAWDFLGAAGGYVAVGLGTWPISPHALPAVGGSVLAIAVLLLGLVVTLRAEPDSARLAILATLFGGVLVAAATAHARGHGFAGRFVTPSAAVLAVAWLGFAVRPTAGWLTGALALLFGAFVYTRNIDQGLREGYEARCIAYELNADIAAGVPPVFLAGRYGSTVPVFGGDATADYLKAYQHAGVKAFAGLAPDPAFRTEPVAGVAVPFDFECPEHEFLASPRAISLPDAPPGAVGVRFRVRTKVPAGWHRVRLNWNGGSAVAYPPWVGAERFHLAFPLPAGATGLRFTADSIVQVFTVDAVEWMLRE